MKLRDWLIVAIVLSCAIPLFALPASSPRSREVTGRVRPALTSALAKKGMRFGTPIFVRIFKEESELELWIEKGQGFELFRTYPICSWSGSLGPKQRAGDGQSPEGFYFVTAERMNPSSNYHLSFDLGYPNSFDRANDRTGSALMVHGNCVSIGCYAMTDPSIEEIWTLADGALRNGQTLFRVHVFPFRMTDRNIARHRTSEWADFWANLREGYDWFERTHRPPDVVVRGRRYEFR